MRQKYATEEDAHRIMNHITHLRKLDKRGFYETMQFVYKREVVPIGFIPKNARGVD